LESNVIPTNPATQNVPNEPQAPRPLIRRLWDRVSALLKDKLFVVCVLIPTVLAVLYYGLLASDIYISESRFVIRSPQRTAQPGLVGAILQGTGFARSQDDTFSVHDFITSRDALRELDEKLRVRTAFNRPNVDFLSRFPGLDGDDSFEALYKYYGKRVSIDNDSVSSISVLRVSAFNGQEAQAINSLLLTMSERLINQINERGRQDLIKFSQTEVAEAEKKAKDATVALAGYRNQRGVFDPDRQSAIQLQQISKLQDELIASKTQIEQIKSLSPENPQIPVLNKRIQVLQREMDSEMAKVAGGGGNTLTNKAADFERLVLERAFADRQLASAMASLETARNEARRKQLYLERVVQPNTPDKATEPRRLRMILTSCLFGLLAWGIFSMLASGIKEHRDD
jgi:capsular polysaccharide transport system permease protein